MNGKENWTQAERDLEQGLKALFFPCVIGMFLVVLLPHLPKDEPKEEPKPDIIVEIRQAAPAEKEEHERDAEEQSSGVPFLGHPVDRSSVADQSVTE